MNPIGKQNKEIIDNMEFLMKELHQEWDRTGAVKASVFISLEEVEDVHKVILLEWIRRNQNDERSYGELFYMFGDLCWES